MTFKDYIQLDEVLITLGNRPNFGQVILLAGGAGSGKAFVRQKIIGISSKVFDVDSVKEKLLRMINDKKISNKNKGASGWRQKILDKYNIDVLDLDMQNPDNTAKLHHINKELGISDKSEKNFFNSLVVNQKNLPNVTFDTTLKSEGKIQKLIDQVQSYGYKKENIHIIWIMNDFEVSKKQNKSRPRVVADDTLKDTHLGVAFTIQNLMRNHRFSEFIDGYVYIVFNKKFIDSTMIFSNFGGSYVKDTLILKVKDRNQKELSYSDISTKFIKKIKEYVPKEAKRLWENYNGKIN